MASDASAPSTNTWMSARFSRWFGLGCLGLTLILDVIFLALLPYGDHEDYSLAGVIVAMPTFLLFSAVGALILSRLPGHPIGVLFALAALAMMTTNAVANYVTATRFDLPARAALAALADPLWPISAAALAIYLPLLFPTGTYLGPRFRWAGLIAAVCLLLIFLSWAFRPGPLVDTEGYDNPFGIPGVGGVLKILEAAALAGLLAAILAGVVSLVLRFWRSRGVEREQLKWFVAAILAVITLFVVISPLADVGGVTIPDAVYLLLMGLVPPRSASQSSATASTIDLIINRTLVYATLTAFLAGLYAASVQLSKLVFDDVTGGSDAALVATTLILAAAFTPAKNNLQKLVDRYYGHVHAPSRDLELYTDRLRSLILLDVAESTRQFLEQAVHSLGARSGRIDLHENGATRCVALHGDPFDAAVAQVSLRHAGQEVGVMSLGPRPDGAAYAAGDLEALQAAAGLLAHAISVAAAFAPAAERAKAL